MALKVAALSASNTHTHTHTHIQCGLIIQTICHTTIIIAQQESGDKPYTSKALLSRYLHYAVARITFSADKTIVFWPSIKTGPFKNKANTSAGFYYAQHVWCGGGGTPIEV